MNQTNLKRVASDVERRNYEQREKERRQVEGKLYSKLYQLEQKVIPLGRYGKCARCAKREPCRVMA